MGGSAADSGKVQPPHCGVPCSTVTPGRVNSSRKRRPRTNMTPPVARPTTAVDATILVNHSAMCDLLINRQFVQTSACLERETNAFVAHPSPCRKRLAASMSRFSARHRVNHIAIAIDGSIQIAPFPFDVDVGFINVPGPSYLPTS